MCVCVCVCVCVCMCVCVCVWRGGGGEVWVETSLITTTSVKVHFSHAVKSCCMQCPWHTTLFYPLPLLSVSQGLFTLHTNIEEDLNRIESSSFKSTLIHIFVFTLASCFWGFLHFLSTLRKFHEVCAYNTCIVRIDQTKRNGFC